MPHACLQLRNPKRALRKNKHVGDSRKYTYYEFINQQPRSGAHNEGTSAHRGGQVSELALRLEHRGLQRFALDALLPQVLSQ